MACLWWWWCLGFLGSYIKSVLRLLLLLASVTPSKLRVSGLAWKWVAWFPLKEMSKVTPSSLHVSWVLQMCSGCWCFIQFCLVCAHGPWALCSFWENRVAPSKVWILTGRTRGEKKTGWIGSTYLFHKASGLHDSEGNIYVHMLMVESYPVDMHIHIRNLQLCLMWQICRYSFQFH